MIESLRKFRTTLMGIAMLHVLVIHAYYWLGLNFSPLGFTVFKTYVDSCYVSTFLFLSGFGCFYSYSKNSEIKKFFIKRIYRVLVPYILISAPFFFYEDVVKYSAFKTFLFDLTTLQFWVDGNHLGMWYVAILIFCYLIFPLVYCICKSSRYPIISGGVILIIISLLTVLLRHYAPEYYAKIEYGLQFIPYFVAGAIIPFISEYLPKMWEKIVAMIILLFTLSIIPMLGLLIYLYLLENTFYKRISFFTFLGEYSLEIYLLHMLLLHIMPESGNSLLFVIVCYISTFLLCKPIHFFCKRCINACKDCIIR